MYNESKASQKSRHAEVPPSSDSHSDGNGFCCGELERNASAGVTLEWAAAGKSHTERSKSAGKHLSVSLIYPETLWFSSLQCTGALQQVIAGTLCLLNKVGKKSRVRNRERELLIWDWSSKNGARHLT